LLEVMSAGAPRVALNVGGNRAILTDGGTALIELLRSVARR
jgi:hypothetical protein